MTFLDRALLNNPRLTANQIIAEMCPTDLDLESVSFCPAIDPNFEYSFEVCGECWNRAVPNE